MSEQIIVTVSGVDKVGIVARVTAALAQYQVNIEDIKQTLMQGHFVMFLLGNIEKSKYSFKEIKDALIDAFGAGAVVEGQIDRAYISRAVFGRPEALKCLNAIVHPAVRNDLEQWLAQCSMEYAFVETAILQSSNFKDLIKINLSVESSDCYRYTTACMKNITKCLIFTTTCDAKRRRPNRTLHIWL